MTSYNVLVVEDSPTMRQLIVFALKRIRGFKIAEAITRLDAARARTVTAENQPGPGCDPPR